MTIWRGLNSKSDLKCMNLILHKISLSLLDKYIFLHIKDYHILSFNKYQDLVYNWLAWHHSCYYPSGLEQKSNSLPTNTQKKY